MHRKAGSEGTLQRMPYVGKEKVSSGASPGIHHRSEGNCAGRNAFSLRARPVCFQCGQLDIENMWTPFKGKNGKAVTDLFTSLR